MGAIYRIVGSGDRTLYVGQTRQETPARRFIEHVRTWSWASDCAGFQVLEDGIADADLNAAEKRWATAMPPLYGNWSPKRRPVRLRQQRRARQHRERGTEVAEAGRGAVLPLRHLGALGLNYVAFVGDAITGHDAFGAPVSWKAAV